jgi:hypothetical protein
MQRVTGAHMSRAFEPSPSCCCRLHPSFCTQGRRANGSGEMGAALGPKAVATASAAAAAAALDRQVALSAFAALFYGTCSIGLVMINKWAFILFPLTNLVLLLQLALTLAVFAAQRAAAPSAAFPAWSGAAARSAAPLSALYLGNVVFSLLSLKGEGARRALLRTGRGCAQPRLGRPGRAA